MSSNLTKDRSLRKLEVNNEFHQVGDQASGDGSHHNVNAVVAANFKGCMPELVMMMVVDGVNTGVEWSGVMQFAPSDLWELQL